jgi:hypothetical protein
MECPVRHSLHASDWTYDRNLQPAVKEGRKPFLMSNRLQRLAISNPCVCEEREETGARSAPILWFPFAAHKLAARRNRKGRNENGDERYRNRCMTGIIQTVEGRGFLTARKESTPALPQQNVQGAALAYRPASPATISRVWVHFRPLAPHHGAASASLGRRKISGRKINTLSSPPCRLAVYWAHASQGSGIEPCRNFNACFFSKLEVTWAT